jgi:hypothetical protein
MTIGYKTALTVPLALVSHLVQLSWNFLPLSGAHQAMQGFLFCLMWADCGAVLSLDAWLTRRHCGVQPVPKVSIAPLRLLRYQLALIYFASAIWKLYDPLWRNGTAVYYVLNQNVFQRFPGSAPLPDWLTAPATYGTLLFELGFAFLLVVPVLRRFALIGGVLLHVGMLALLEIGPFHLVMLAGYLSFLNPESVPTLLGRLRRFKGEAGSRLVTLSGSGAASEATNRASGKPIA